MHSAHGRSCQYRLRSLLGRRFRTNEQFRLQRLDALPGPERVLLSGLAKAYRGQYVLRPTDAARSVLSVDSKTARLLVALRSPARLPHFLLQAVGISPNLFVSQLVLDGILEVDADGKFRSGADAFGVVFASASWGPPPGVLARLSIEALKYAQGLCLVDRTVLSARLYYYNRLPLSPQWLERYPTSEALARELGLITSGHTLRLLDARWLKTQLPAGNDWWFHWVSRSSARARRRAHYKLYVSPKCEFVRDAFEAVVDIVSSLDARSLKIGKDAAGVLRPDKIVIYFHDLKTLLRASDRLHSRLHRVPVHGVPFTSALDDAGLLSWGLDPPNESARAPWHAPSWRRWITDRLASALANNNRPTGTTREPWEFALARLALDGVDTCSWAPGRSLREMV